MRLAEFTFEAISVSWTFHRRTPDLRYRLCSQWY
eukprot:IDg20174t1